MIPYLAEFKTILLISTVLNAFSLLLYCLVVVVVRLTRNDPGRASQRASVEGVVCTTPSCILLFLSPCFPPVQLCVWHSHLWRWPLFLHFSLRLVFCSSLQQFCLRYDIFSPLCLYFFPIKPCIIVLLSETV